MQGEVGLEALLIIINYNLTRSYAGAFHVIQLTKTETMCQELQ